MITDTLAALDEAIAAAVEKVSTSGLDRPNRANAEHLALCSAMIDALMDAKRYRWLSDAECDAAIPVAFREEPRRMCRALIRAGAASRLAEALLQEKQQHDNAVALATKLATANALLHRYYDAMNRLDNDLAEDTRAHLGR